MTRQPQAIPPAVHALLQRLAASGTVRDFYLAGGTGLALLLNHRRSVDLDFFSRVDRLDFAGRRALVARLRRLPGWRLLEAKDGTVHGRVGRVRVSFFWYPEPLMKPLVRRGPLRVASLEDIGLMKLAAIIGRGSRKDFVDLYAICQRRALPRLLAMGRRKFRDVRDFPLQAMKALTFFEDAEREPVVVTPVPLSWERVMDFFSREVRVLARRHLRAPNTIPPWPRCERQGAGSEARRRRRIPCDTPRRSNDGAGPLPPQPIG